MPPARFETDSVLTSFPRSRRESAHTTITADMITSQLELIDHPPPLESEVVRIKEDYARFGLVPFLPGKSWAAHRQSKYGAALSPCMAEYAGKDLQGSSGDSFEMGKRIMLRCICAHSRTFMRCARWTMLQLSSSLHPSYNTMRGGQNER